MELLSSHPSRADLLDYADALERSAGQPSAAVYAHVSACDRCAAEVERARATVAVASHAAAIEPSREWRAQMLLNARQVRRRHHGRLLRVRSSPRSPRRTAIAATGTLLLVASVSLLAIYQTGGHGYRFNSVSAPSRAAVFSLDVLRQATPAERLLAPTVLGESDPATPWEASQHRAVLAWDAEIDEALEALESNPACTRAAALVNTNRERLGETLKVLYVERDF